jgi:excisionase family DNA binding protein
MSAMSVAEFCAAFGISKPTFYRYMRSGVAPATMKLGRRRVISRDAVRNWQTKMEAESARSA